MPWQQTCLVCVSELAHTYTHTHTHTHAHTHDRAWKVYRFASTLVQESAKARTLYSLDPPVCRDSNFFSRKWSEQKACVFLCLSVYVPANQRSKLLHRDLHVLQHRLALRIFCRLQHVMISAAKAKPRNCCEKTRQPTRGRYLRDKKITVVAGGRQCREETKVGSLETRQLLHNVFNSPMMQRHLYSNK